MGGIVSTVPSGVKSEWMDVFKAMKLTRDEIIRMLEIYNKIDCDRSGNIDVVELLTLLDIERTAFTERIFSAFDKDATGQIDFYEFTVSVWKFCTLGEGSISVFTFDIFDTDADGILDANQVITMFHDLTGNRAEESERIRLALNELTKSSSDGSVTIEKFKEFCKTHQVLLARPFAVQDKLRLYTLGEGCWEKVALRPIEVRRGLTVKLCDLMTLHSDRKQFRDILEDRTALRVDSMMRIVLENTDNAAHHAEATARSAALAAKNSASGEADKATTRQQKKQKAAAGKTRRPTDLMH